MLNEPIPDEAFDTKRSYDEDEDEDDENCATKIQSREEILRDIAAAAAASAAAAGAPASSGPVDSPRLIKSDSVNDEESVPRPSTDLLLMAPPTSAEEKEADDLLGHDDFDDDELGPKTVLENVIPDGFFDQVPPIPKQPSTPSGVGTPPPIPKANSNSGLNKVSSQAASAKPPSVPPFSYRPSPQAVFDDDSGFPISSKPVGPNTYVAPKEAIRPPSSDDDDDFFL
jgi:hypothetical protein